MHQQQDLRVTQALATSPQAAIEEAEARLAELTASIAANGTARSLGGTFADSDHHSLDQAGLVSPLGVEERRRGDGRGLSAADLGKGLGGGSAQGAPLGSAVDEGIAALERLGVGASKAMHRMSQGGDRAGAFDGGSVDGEHDDGEAWVPLEGGAMVARRRGDKHILVSRDD